MVEVESSSLLASHQNTVSCTCTTSLSVSYLGRDFVCIASARRQFISSSILVLQFLLSIPLSVAQSKSFPINSSAPKGGWIQKAPIQNCPWFFQRWKNGSPSVSLGALWSAWSRESCMGSFQLEQWMDGRRGVD